MKYCPSCKRIITDDADLCSVCNAASSELTAEAPVTVATIKGTFLALAESSLKDAGIPCTFEKLDGNVYNSLNAKITAESDYRVLVPFELYSKAFDVCVGAGLAEHEDRLVPETETDENTDTTTYDEKFQSANGVSRRTWQILWTALFIVAACLIIWGIDWIAHLINPYLT